MVTGLNFKRSSPLRLGCCKLECAGRLTSTRPRRSSQSALESLSVKLAEKLALWQRVTYIIGMAKANRSYTQKTLKTLFALSGNRCAYLDCDTPVIAPATEHSDLAVIGKIAHIIAASSDGPRGKDGITQKQLNSHENLILLCPTHHDLVDTQHETYPASMLGEWKKIREQSIAQQRSDLAVGLHDFTFSIELADAEITKRLVILRKARFFGGFDQYEAASALSKRIVKGDLRCGSNLVKSHALAWCARFLANDDTDTAERLLIECEPDHGSGEQSIAQAFIYAAKGKPSDSLNLLSKLDSPTSKSAAFFVITNDEGASKGLEWLKNVGYQLHDLDSDGKFYFIAKCFECDQWDSAHQAASELGDIDFQNTPALYFSAAMANLVHAIPEEYRKFIAQQVPFEVGNFPLSTTSKSLLKIRQAQEYFEKCEQAAVNLDLNQAANIASDYSLWLELRDPKSKEKAKDKLRASLSNPAHSLRRLNFALQFGLKLDLDAVAKEIDRKTAETGGKSIDAALARFALAFTQKSEGEIADYIDHYRNQLNEHLDQSSIARLEIEMLSRAGRVEEAEHRLEELQSNDVDDRIKLQLQRIISEATGTNPIVVRIKEYEQAPSLNSLGNLVDLLEEQKDWMKMAQYAVLLHDQVKSVESAKKLAHALNEQGDLKSIHQLLSDEPEFIDQSEILKSLWCLALYHNGEIEEPRKIIDELRSINDRENYREFWVNIAITSGDWESLATHIEAEWLHRNERNSKELLRVAQFAHMIQSTRVKDLLREATSKAADDPNIFLGAYSIAMSEGWEDEEVVFNWFQNALRLSGDDGPIQRVSLNELVESKPDWDKREFETWQNLGNGKIPIFGAAMSINRTLCDVFLLPAIANRNENDPRRKANIYSYSAVRQPVSLEIKKIGFDATALLTLSILKLTDIVIDCFEEIIIPHTTLGWLFEERQRIRFHQPSRLRNATEIRELIQNDQLHYFAATSDADPDLSAEVGSELAAFIFEARAMLEEEPGKHFVIRSAPVHTVGTLMDQEADLSEYSALICSCVSVIEKLEEKGQLTASETKKAKAYLGAHEQRWPIEPEIDDNAVLYLDDLSVTYLQHVGVLAKLNPAGFRVYVSQRETNEIKSLLRYQSLASDADNALDRLRTSLAGGIRNGEIKLGLLPSPTPEENDRFRLHPTAAILDIAPLTDAIVVDDRFINQHRQVDQDGAVAPIITTADLIDILRSRGVISEQQKWDLRTSLRQAGFMFLPIVQGELEHHLLQATIIDSELRETAELRAVRQSIMQMRMSKALHLPKEANWLIEFHQSVANTLRSQWVPEVDGSVAEARSNWLLNLLDMRGWAAGFQFDVGANFGASSQLASVLLLLRPPEKATSVVTNQYWEWLERSVLSQLELDAPDIYEQVLRSIEESVAQITDLRIERLTDDSK